MAAPGHTDLYRVELDAAPTVTLQAERCSVSGGELVFEREFAGKWMRERSFTLVSVRRVSVRAGASAWQEIAWA